MGPPWVLLVLIGCGAKREMRGITLDEITESTKVSRRHLEALEGEHFDQLPGGVFNERICPGLCALSGDR